MGCSRRNFLRVAGGALAGSALVDSVRGGLAFPELHEARFWTSLPNNVVRCQLCPWGCVVAPGRRGRCGVRENRNGRYYSLVYGRPVTLNNDPIEKKPFFHVYPGSKAFSLATVGCNFQCKFCQNWDISQESPDNVNPPYQSPAAIADMAIAHRSRTVAYTYNEPSVFNEYVVDCARAAKERGLGNVVVSNGYLNEAPLKDVCSVVTAVKIDFKAFSQDFYGNVCSGRLQPVLDTLQRLAGSGVWYEIVVLTIPTLNDNLDDVKRMSGWIVKELGPDVPLHFTRFHSAYKLQNLPPTPPATLQQARATAMAQGCHFVYTGNMPGDEGEHTYCPQCKTRVIERYGLSLPQVHLVDGKCPNCHAAIPGVWS